MIAHGTPPRFSLFVGDYDIHIIENEVNRVKRQKRPSGLELVDLETWIKACAPPMGQKKEEWLCDVARELMRVAGAVYQEAYRIRENRNGIGGTDEPRKNLQSDMAVHDRTRERASAQGDREAAKALDQGPGPSVG